MVGVETTLVRELYRACRCVKGKGGTITADVEGCRVFVCVGLLRLSVENRCVGVVEKGLEGVGDNWLIGIAKMYDIGDDVATGCVNEVGCAYVILVHGGQSCTREGNLERCIVVETDVEFSCATFELLVEHGWNMEAVVCPVKKCSVGRLCSCV